MSKNKKTDAFCAQKEVKVETKIKEDVNLQQIDSVDFLEETLGLSPFCYSLSREELESIENRILNPKPMQPVSNRRH